MRLGQSQTGLALYPLIVTPPPAPPPVVPGPFVPVDLSAPIKRPSNPSLYHSYARSPLLFPAPPPVTRSLNYGYYGNFNTSISKNGTVANVAFETDLVGGSPAGILGYNFSVTWAFLEPSQNNYNLAGFMSLYNKMAGYPIPRRTWITIQVGAFTSTHPGTNDDSIIPLYLQQNVGLYGQSGYRVAGVTTQPGGVSGWWGGDGNGNTYAVRMDNANVTARFIALIQWLGSVANTLPLFEGVIFQENSFWVGALADNGGSGYSDVNAYSQQSLLTAAASAALPNKNVSYENTFLADITRTQNFASVLINNSCLPGMTDSKGQTTINNSGGVLPTWGMAAYGGVQLPGSSAVVQNWRPGVPSCCQIEAPDFGAFGGIAGTNVPITLTSAPIAGATSAQISPSSNGGYWPNGVALSLRFSNGTLRTASVSDTKTFDWAAGGGGVGAGLTAAITNHQGGADGWTPQDMADAYRGSLNTAYVFIVVIPNSATYVTIDKRWPAASATFLNNPLTFAGVPSNY